MGFFFPCDFANFLTRLHKLVALFRHEKEVVIVNVLEDIFWYSSFC